MYKLIFTPLLLIFSLDFVADDDKVNIEAGQTWLLESKSNRLSISNSEVLFFFSSDAYNTYQARKFSDWDHILFYQYIYCQINLGNIKQVMLFHLWKKNFCF